MKSVKLTRTKALFCFLMAMALCLPLAACGGQDTLEQSKADDGADDDLLSEASNENSEISSDNSGEAEQKTYKFLFIGNSATSVNNIPRTLKLLLDEKGISVTVKQLIKSGYTLAQHADTGTTYGKTVFAEIANGYDAVFIQDNASCISSDELGNASKDACRRLAEAVKESGAKLYIYVRPPYEKDLSGYNTIEQSQKLDEHFVEIAEDNDATCVFVNRSFAYAATNLNHGLWGDDNAHTSTYGAYLAVCTFYVTLFGTTATELPTAYEIPEKIAKDLQNVADKIALEGIIPWEAE